MGDGDDSYDFSQLDEFVAELRKGADLVMGNRFKGGIAPGAMPPLHRYLGNPILSWLGRTFFRVNVGDFHCGLRGFSRDAMLRLGLVSPGMEFATEMVAKAALAGYSIREVPTTLSPDGRNRPPHLRTWRDGWRHLLFMLLFTPRWLFLIPGSPFWRAVGLVGMVACWHAVHRPLGPMGLDVHSMLYFSAAVIIGAQLVQFALLVKWIAVVAGDRARARVGDAGEATIPAWSSDLSSAPWSFFAGLAWTSGLGQRLADRPGSAHLIPSPPCAPSFPPLP
jgi:hypothetical protein